LAHWEQYLIKNFCKCAIHLVVSRQPIPHPDWGWWELANMASHSAQQGVWQRKDGNKPSQ